MASPKPIDLTGQKFGKLTALRYEGKQKWLVRCDCGTEKFASSQDLRSGNVKTCGAAGCKGTLGIHPRTRAVEDVSGQVFGMLTAIRYVTQKGKTGKWICRCDCGNEVHVPNSELRNGHTKSCGCLKGILARERASKHYEGIVGDQFGFLTVIEDKGYDHGVKTLVCQCACGSVRDYNATYLIDGSTKSCGCYSISRTKEMGYRNAGKTAWNKGRGEDLSGNRYGRLLVLGKSSVKGGRGILFDCRCDCGNTKTLLGYELRSGSHNSCGCLRQERLKQKSERSYECTKCKQVKLRSEFGSYGAGNTARKKFCLQCEE